MADTNTTTKPGVLQVMDAEIASLPIMAEMMTRHDGDAFDAEEAVRRMTEARATVERLAEAMADLIEVSLLAVQFEFIPENADGPLPKAIDALAAFRGDL